MDGFAANCADFFSQLLRIQDNKITEAIASDETSGKKKIKSFLLQSHRSRMFCCCYVAVAVIFVVAVAVVVVYRCRRRRRPPPPP